MIKNKILKGISALLLISTLCGMIFTVPAAAGAAGASDKYAIAVVYDNSGSMYGGTTENDKLTRWCEAQYAIEIFASMLEFPRDELTVFPMHKTNVSNASGIIEIKSDSDREKLKKMYTPDAGGTPFSTVENAIKYLKGKTDFQKKWLVVLTDGIFSKDDFPGVENSADQITKYAFEKIYNETAQHDINVHYIGFEVNVTKYDKDFENIQAHYAQSAGEHSGAVDNDKSISSVLINVCNNIFQRDKLKSNYLQGNELTLGISMKKLLVFVQGQGANVKSIDGKRPVGDSGQIKFRQQNDSTKTKVNFDVGTFYIVPKPNEDLYGQVATFGAMQKGTYTLDMSGVDSDKIQIFYEPDVRVKTTITNKDTGEVIDTNNGGEIEAAPGEYMIEYELIDAQTKESVSNSDLLGDVKFDARLTQDGKTTVIGKSGSVIQLGAAESTDILIEAEYLGKYKVSTKDDAFFPKITITWPTLDFDSCELKAYGERSLKKKEINKNEIQVEIIYNGKTFTAAEIEKVELIEFKITPVSTEKECITAKSYKYEGNRIAVPLERNDSEELIYGPYKVAIKAKLNGYKDNPEVSGDFTFTVVPDDFNVKLTDENGKSVESVEMKKAEISSHGPVLVEVEFDKRVITTDEYDLEVTLDGQPYEHDGNKIPMTKTAGLSNGDHKLRVKAMLKGTPEIAEEKEITVTILSADFIVNVTTDQSGNWFCVSEHGSWKPVYVELTYEGEPLNAKQFAEAKDSLKITGLSDVTHTLTDDPDNSRFVIEIGKNKDGEFVRPSNGSYTIKAEASLDDGTGEQITSSGSMKFSVRTIPFWLLLLIILAIIAALVVAFLLFMNMKVLPKEISAQNTRFVTISGTAPIGEAKPKYSRKDKRITINTPAAVPYGQRCSVTFKIAAADNRWTPSKKRRITITDIKAPNMKEVTVNSKPFRYDEKLKTFIPTIGAAPAKKPDVLVPPVRNAAISIKNNPAAFKDQATLTVSLLHK